MHHHGTREPIRSETANVNHDFQPGDRVRTCRLALVKAPDFFDAHVVAPIPHIANLYIGRCWGERRFSHFFAHSVLQSEEAERALLQHFIATIDPRRFYPING
jgi:hypothetical protein